MELVGCCQLLMYFHQLKEFYFLIGLNQGNHFNDFDDFSETNFESELKGFKNGEFIEVRNFVVGGYL